MSEESDISDNIKVSFKLLLMKLIIPFLWFNDNAETAVEFYVSIFPNSKIINIARYPKDTPFPAVPGKVMTIEFELNGQKFMALDGGPQFKFSEAVSFLVECDNQQEVDMYWDKLTKDGGEESQCGWLKDKFGFSWQIVPKVVNQMMLSGETEKITRMSEAMLGMKKLIVSDLQKAYNSQ